MTLDELGQQVKRLDEKIDARAKDAWDKWQVVGTLLGGVLVPVALALAGYAFSQALTRQQIRSSEEIGTNSLRLGQYQIIAGLMKSLVSSDPNERKQAINFVFIVMPEDDAHRLVDRLSQTDSDSSVRAFATNALNARVSELANDAVSADALKSQEAYSRLTNAWRNDPRVAHNVLAAANRWERDPRAQANSVEILSGLDPRQLQEHSNEVFRVLNRASANNPQIQRSVRELQSKLQAPP